VIHCSWSLSVMGQSSSSICIKPAFEHRLSIAKQLPTMYTDKTDQPKLQIQLAQQSETFESIITMCKKQPFCYRCGHERSYKLIECGHSALCNADTAKRLEPEYVNGSCGTCAKLAAEALPPRKDAGCCVVQSARD
jgi:hypothetical protein